MEDTKKVPYAEFGDRLERLRKSRNMTRVQLAEICGIAPSTILNYERGTRIPYADTAVKMAQTFGLTVEDLLGLENPDAEMEKAKAIDAMGRLYGKRSADSAQAYLDGTNALLAGGTLSAEDQLDFISVMRKVLVDAEIRAKQRFTPNKFRTPEWKVKTDAIRSDANAVINSIDEEMSSRSPEHDASAADDGRSNTMDS